jgi:hypothetical protein
VLRASREQVVAFRLSALHLDRRLAAESLAGAACPVGFQDTPPGNAAIAAAARVEGLTAARWEHALGEARTLVGLWAMRGSSCVVASDDLPVFTSGLLPEDERALLHRITSTFDEVVEASGVGAAELVDRLTERARQELASQRLTKRELGRALAPALPEAILVRLDEGATTWGGYDLPSALALTVARLVALRGVFVIAPRSGNELSFVRTDEWLGSDPARIAHAEARAELARRFLRAYAPATAVDLAWWTTEQTSARARRAHEEDAQLAWERVADELEEVEVDGRRGFVLAADAGRLDSPPEPRTLRLLPPHDPLLMLRDRDTLVPEPFHKHVWRSQHNPGVVLDRGEAVATWRARKQGRRLVVQVEPLGGPLDAAARAALESEAERAAAVRGCDAAEVVPGA